MTCECGSKKFSILETISHHAEVNANGVLEAFKQYDNSISMISCENCDKEYTENDFKSVEFCQ